MIMVRNLFYGNASVEPYNIISDRIYDDVPPQIKILNIVIPILMSFYTLHIKNTIFCPQRKLRQGCKINTLINHKQRCS